MLKSDLKNGSQRLFLTELWMYEDYVKDVCRKANRILDYSLQRVLPPE